MKSKFIHIAMVLLLLVVASGCKKEWDKTVTVERDCTGTYLRMHGKDYFVCNTETTDPYSEGANVKASFRLVDECDAYYGGCELYHKWEGVVVVEKIN